MTSSTISVNFNDTAQKTVFTATEKCILKLSPSGRNTSNDTQVTFRLNSTNIGNYNDYFGAFMNTSRSLANILSPMCTGQNDGYPTALILYLEEGDTVYATRTTGNAFTLSLYSAVFTF